MTYWQNPHFKAMQQAWYATLEEDGFEDVEEMVADEMVLKQISAHPYRGLDELVVSNKETYYRIIGQKVQESLFQNEIDRLILAMFAEGAKIKRIVETLETTGKRRCRGTIRYTIRKYEMSWGLRSYSPKQLNKKAQRSA